MRAKDFFIKESTLLEINMSPSSLRQLASQIDARAGMEFEMIVPNSSAGEEEELEPDYEQDERARDIEQIVDFFDDGTYNDSRAIRRLESDLGDDYQDWKYEALAERWDRQGFDYLKEYIERYDYFNRDEAVDTARDEIMDANPDLPPESEEFQKLLSNRVNEMEEQYVQDEWDLGIEGKGRVYDEAQTEFNDDEADDLDEYDWLRSRGWYHMTDIEREFDVSWPHWTYTSTGSREINDVASSFEYAIGKPTVGSSGYHRAARRPGQYIVEPDGSLEGDDAGDAGLEFVSPPMPVAELFDDLKKVKEWAEREGCYTNESTGLHMNISVPSLKGNIENLDYVKLALLLGDKYVLESFNRSGNTYCKSALDKVQSLVKTKPDSAKELLDKMKGHLADLASKSIHTGITDKYTSINTKGGYVEFRSPGEDWLGANFDLIENTMLRFVVALDAACDPQKYRQEYLKKLYLLLEPTAVERKSKDTIKYFADYVAGNMPKAALRSFVKQAQLERSVAKGKTTGPMWWSVTNPANNAASIEVVANNKEEAIASAILPGNYPEWARVKNTLKATPLRPYEAPKAKSAASPGQGNWGIWINTSQRFAREPGEYPAGQEPPLRRFPTREAGDAFLAQTREQNPRMRTDVEVREIPAEPTVPQGGSTGNWGVWVPNLDRYATIGNAGPRRFNSEADARAWIQDYNARHSGNDLELVAREIDTQPASQEQSGRYTYRVFTDTNQTVGTFQSDGIQGSTAAMVAFRNYLRSIGRDSASGFNYEEIGRERQSSQFQEPSNDRGDLTPRGPGPWEIYRLSDNSSVRELSNTSRPEAEVEARRALGLRGEAPELYGVRTRQAAIQQQPQQQRFTGYWDVKMDDEVVFRVQAETQSEANQKAREWILGRSREFLHDHEGQEVSVVPRYE